MKDNGKLMFNNKSIESSLSNVDEWDTNDFEELNPSLT
jgi:hypothetical protein